MTILRNVLRALEIPEDLVVLAPPVLDRTDFGYTPDVDLVFFGTDEQKEELHRKLYTSFGLAPFIIHLNPEELTEIKENLPELYQFLMQRKGNIQTIQTKEYEIEAKEYEIEATKNYEDEAAELETKSRSILSIEDKLRLRKQRLEIGNNFVNEVRQRVSVLRYKFSGSMITNMKRFGTISDLDIFLLINLPDEKAKRIAYYWIHFLKWKQAEEFGIKVDVHDTDLEFARKMASLDPRFVEVYKEKFGVDITGVKE